MPSNESHTRIDGGKASPTLLDRINSEEFVGASLQQKSREDYARKMGVLENQIRKKNGAGTTLSPARLAAHLSEQFSRGSMAQATARSMKAAALFWIAETGAALIAKGSEGFSEYELAYERIRALSTTALPKKTDQTSSPKLKALPADVLETLERYGNSTPGVVYIGPLLAFLRANLLVGLRPDEWFDTAAFTYLTPRRLRSEATLALRVRNSKATYGRANGSHREILLHEVAEQDLAALLHFLELVENHRLKHPRATPHELSTTFFGPLRHCMSNALSRTGYRHGSGSQPTLYSSRHQAVANAKASGLTDREIAALFGHVSTSTAKSHYGKKLSAWGKTTFRPSPESLKAVVAFNQRQDVSKPTERILRAASEWIKGASHP